MNGAPHRFYGVEMEAGNVVRDEATTSDWIKFAAYLAIIYGATGAAIWVALS